MAKKSKKAKAKTKGAKTAPKVKVIQITYSGYWSGRQEYAYTVKNKPETWVDGYARPFTAKRGAQRAFKEWTSKGGVLKFERV